MGSTLTFPSRLVFYQTPLSSLHQRMLCDRFGVAPPWDEPNEPFRGGACLIVWLANLLAAQPWLASEARGCLFGTADADLKRHGEQLQEAFDEFAISKRWDLVPTVTLAFAENRFVTWTDAAGWLDLYTGDVRSLLPVTPLETLAYNLTELFRRNRARCESQLCQPSPVSPNTP